MPLPMTPAPITATFLIRLVAIDVSILVVIKKTALPSVDLVSRGEVIAALERFIESRTLPVRGCDKNEVVPEGMDARSFLLP
jgi:hypothetical protein